MYNVEITLWNVATLEIRCKETVKFYSRWAARTRARDYAKCVDVCHVLVIDNETGEIVLELDTHGEVLWDTEG